MGRSKEEMEGVTLLGNKDVKYSMDYAPEMLQTFDNKHTNRTMPRKYWKRLQTSIRTMITGYTSTARNLQASVRSPDSLTSQRCTYHMCRARRWWRASR